MSVPIPEVITKAWAENGTYVAPPDTASATVANQDTGYPVLQQTPYSLGGIAVKRNETNGAFNLYSSHIRYLQAGGTYTFEAAVSTAFTGYHQGAMLAYQRSDGSFGILYSAINNNTNNFVTTPAVIGTDWIDISNGAFPDIIDTIATGQVVIDGASVKTGTKRMSTENTGNTYVAQNQTLIDGSYVVSQLVTYQKSNSLNQARSDVFWETDGAVSPTFYASWQSIAQHDLGSSNLRSASLTAVPYHEVGNYFPSYIISMDNNIDNNNGIILQSFEDAGDGKNLSAYIKDSGVLENGWQIRAGKRMRILGDPYPIDRDENIIIANDLKYVRFVNDPAYGNGINQVRYTKLCGRVSGGSTYEVWQATGWFNLNVVAGAPLSITLPVERFGIIGTSNWSMINGVHITEDNLGGPPQIDAILTIDSLNVPGNSSPYITINSTANIAATGETRLQFSFTLEAT